MKMQDATKIRERVREKKERERKQRGVKIYTKTTEKRFDLRE